MRSGLAIMVNSLIIDPSLQERGRVMMTAGWSSLSHPPDYASETLHRPKPSPDGSMDWSGQIIEGCAGRDSPEVSKSRSAVDLDLTKPLGPRP